MPSVLVRDVEDEVLERLKMRAERNDRSLQSELSLLLRRASEQNDLASRLDIARKVRGSIKKAQTTDSVKLLREDRRR